MEHTRRLKAAERIINTISSGFLRAFVVMMYIENMPQRVVRNELNMNEWEFGQARQAVEMAEDLGSVCVAGEVCGCLNANGICYIAL